MTLLQNDIKTPTEWTAGDPDSYDVSVYIGSYSDNERPWPMVSYERAGNILWNAIARQLHKSGWTDDEIKTWLQSKGPRLALDGDLGGAIETLGRLYSFQVTKV